MAENQLPPLDLSCVRSGSPFQCVAIQIENIYNYLNGQIISLSGNTGNPSILPFLYIREPYLINTLTTGDIGQVEGSVTHYFSNFNIDTFTGLGHFPLAGGFNTYAPADPLTGELAQLPYRVLSHNMPCDFEFRTEVLGSVNNVRLPHDHTSFNMRNAYSMLKLNGVIDTPGEYFIICEIANNYYDIPVFVTADTGGGEE